MVNLRLWWEDELSRADRTRLMKAIGYNGWEGTREERYAKLKEMHDYTFSEAGE